MHPWDLACLAKLELAVEVMLCRRVCTCFQVAEDAKGSEKLSR